MQARGCLAFICAVIACAVSQAKRTRRCSVGCLYGAERCPTTGVWLSYPVGLPLACIVPARVLAGGLGRRRCDTRAPRSRFLRMRRSFARVLVA